MENCLDTIVVLNDASETEHHPVEKPSRYQKPDSHISMQQEALFRYKQHNRLFLYPHSKKIVFFLNPQKGSVDVKKLANKSNCRKKQ